MLLVKIDFKPSKDTLYILGDVIDRGDKPIECLQFIIQTQGIQMLLGNHEQALLNVYKEKAWYADQLLIWRLSNTDKAEQDKVISYLKNCPLYAEVNVNNTRWFLSHAGLDIKKKIEEQTSQDLLWRRNEFYLQKAIPNCICVFGHTPTFFIRENKNCSVWLDDIWGDKICIDSGCVYGGALSALRLDDGEIFYVQSLLDRIYNYSLAPVPESFLNAGKTKER
jgi:serine/threonine protein phosphatase 1